jgi:FlaA1/EpsC-like NDP-sugar epimerase
VEYSHKLLVVTDRRRERYANLIPSWVFHGYIRVILDGLTAAMAMIYAYVLRFDFHIEPKMQRSMWTWLCVVVVLRPLSIHLSREGYRSTWRFFDVRDGLVLALRSLPVTVLLLLVRWQEPKALPIVPYSVLILEFGIFLVFACTLRLTRRLINDAAHTPVDRPRALIVGSETTLATAVHHLHTSNEAHVLGLVSEDVRLAGANIAGRPVLGHPDSLASLLVSHRIEIVVLSGANLRCAAQVIRDASLLDVQVRILPSGSELMDGRVTVNREVSIDQLTQGGTKILNEAHPAVVQCFNARTVLITGAGGSIGSEMARQVAALNVERLVVLDHDENSIFELMNELGDLNGRKVVPIVGNIRDHDIVHQTFKLYSPQIVLHAAAYKHVPVMEDNCCEAVLNNVAGTRELADAAIEFGCERFVMISTDKAVNPSSIMGATKRTAEMLIQQRAIENAGLQTHFACVRFGNVLGSRGSVVPIFLRQIAAGGPVTITHEEMTRYFMTIPQAVQLVLQAATLASRGDVYLLDMGDPVKIIDFAKEIIHLSGLVPGKDIDIKVVGIRPGEKLHEKLWRDDALVTPTPFREVFQVQAGVVPADFPQLLAELELAARARKSGAEIQELLYQLPIDYCPEKMEATPIAIAN